MRLIIVAGMPGSGKQDLPTVARRMGLPFIRMGDLVREAYAGSRPEGMTMGQFANSERELHGKDVWARRALERMGGETFLVDGCRSMDEVDAFRSLAEDVVVLGIQAPPSARYDRLVKRGREDAPGSEDEFDARDSRESGWGLSEVLALADVTVVNDSSLEEFHARAAETLRGLL